MTKTSSPIAPRGTSVYEHLRERLRAEVVAVGKPGERVPGEKTLATLFGVSPVTMSRALQELQSEGVLLRVPGKGTFLAETTQEQSEMMEESHGAESWSEVTSVSRTTLTPMMLNAAIIANLGISNEGLRYGNWEPRIVSRLENLIQGSGGTTTIINRDATPSTESVARVQALREQGVNSVFLIPNADLPGENYLTDLLFWQQSNPNVALVGFSLSGRDRSIASGVGFDGDYGAFLIGQHLRELGHRRIAYLVPDEPVYFLHNEPVDFIPYRLQALRNAQRGNEDAFVEEVHIPVPEDAQRFEGGYRFPAPERDVWISCGANAARIPDLEQRFSALVFANDSMARGFLLARQEMGQPITASLVGYDDRPFASGLDLTTVHPPLEEMANYAFRLACSRLRQPFEEGRLDVTLKPTLIRRASTRALTM